MFRVVGMERYEELERIGKGSEGSVFLVRDRNTGNTCVIKKIYLRSNPTAASHEAAILASV